MEPRTRRYACLVIAVGLMVVGTFLTGVLPSDLPYQVLAGGVVVAGFGLAYACLGALELPGE